MDEAESRISVTSQEEKSNKMEKESQHENVQIFTQEANTYESKDSFTKVSTLTPTSKPSQARTTKPIHFQENGDLQPENLQEIMGSLNKRIANDKMLLEKLQKISTKQQSNPQMIPGVPPNKNPIVEKKIYSDSIKSNVQ